MDKKLEARIARLEKQLYRKSLNEGFSDMVRDPLIDNIIEVHRQLNSLNVGRNIASLDDDNAFALKRHLQDMKADIDAWLTLL
jgi:hypothetical protein